MSDKNQPTPPPNAARFYAIVVPDDGAPRTHESQSFEGMSAALLQSLLEARAGFCYVFVEGQRAYLSNPLQYFKLKLGDGSFQDVTAPELASFDASGRFFVLQPPLNT